METAINKTTSAGQKTLFWMMALCFFAVSLVSAQNPAAPAKKNSPQFVPGQILIQPKAGISEVDFAGKLKKNGGLHRKTIRSLNVRVVSVPEERVDALLAVLRNDPEIEFAERDFLAQAAFVPNDTYAGNAWHLAKIQAMQAWEGTVGRSEVVVAVLDSGANPAHPDLDGQLVPGFDFLNNTTVMTDEFGHGTAVIGTVAAAGNNGTGVAGVAFGCRVMPVKVMDNSGFAAYSTIAQGIKYAVDNGARVINLSIAGSSSSVTLQNAINYAWSNNVVVVAAAGNNANSTVQYPAACEHVIAVSATMPDDSLTSFSSFGNYVTLSAPGEGIWTTQRDLNNPYGAWRGTSFASPVVAAVAALVISANPTLSSDQVTAMLKQTAEDLGTAGYDPQFGFGRVHALRAVSAASSAPGAVSSAPAPAPAVSITSPTTGSQVNFGASISIQTTASASAANSSVSSVTLYANGAAIGAGSSLNWTPASAGSFSLTAVVRDTHGLSATSAPVNIQVSSGETVAPTVFITGGPQNGARVTAPQIALSGTANDNNGLARVEVQVNNQIQTASGTATWAAEVTLLPGVNTLRVRSVDLAGNVSPEVVRTITYVMTATLGVQVNGLGAVGPLRDGAVLEVGRTYTMKASPAKGYVFAGWTGVPSEHPVLTFMMKSNLTLTANFVPSPFPAVRGNYVGLAANTNGVTPESSGYFSLTVTPSGTFTGKLLLGEGRFGFRGQFNLEGNATVLVSRGTLLSPLQLTLSIDLTGGTDQVTGYLTDGAWVSEVNGDRNVFNPKFNPAKQAGLRDFILERADNVMIKAGRGAGAISTSGSAKVKGELEDGRLFRTSSMLSKNGDCPFYLSFNGGTEVVIGWLNFPVTPNPTASGTVIWVRSGTNAFAATLKAASAP